MFPSHDPGGDITVTTSAAHGLAVGDVITITGTTDYNHRFTIVTVPTTTTFTVTDTFTSDQSGAFEIGDVITLKHVGLYQVNYYADITAAATSKAYEVSISLDNTTEAKSKRTFTSTAGPDKIYGQCVIETTSKNAKLRLDIKGTTDSTNATFNECSLVVRKA